MEALVNLINERTTSGKTGEALGVALKTLNDMGGELHPAMSKAFSGLWMDERLQRYPSLPQG